MGWSEVPVSADALITNAPFDEVMEKIRILWDVHANGWYDNPSWHLMEPEVVTDEYGASVRWWYYWRIDNHWRLDLTGFKFYGNIIEWFRRILYDMHDTTLGRWTQTWGTQSGRMYESGGVPVYRDIDWVLTQCGVSWTELSWGRKVKTAGDCLSEIKTVMDYIKDNAIVATRTSFTGTGYGHMDAYLKGWTSPDTETSWSGARARATGDMNVHFHAPYNGITSWLGAQLGMPFVSMMLDNNGGEWEPYYWGGRYNCMKEKHNQTVAGSPHGRRLSSAGWHADLKRPDCEYWLKFKSGGINYDYCGLPWATHRYKGMVAMPYELNGVDIEGGASANGGAWDSSGRTVPFDYADWDWINDRGDIFFDDSALSFPVPPHCDTPAGWSDASVDYYEGDTVGHSGLNYVSLQDHTSSAGTEPGTPGGDAYWALAVATCWDGADDGDVTGFVWSQPPPQTIYVKPDYAGY